MKLTKKDAVTAIAKKTGYAKADAEIMYKAFVEFLDETLSNNDELFISGVVTLSGAKYVAETQDKKAKNGLTGQDYVREGKPAHYKPQARFAKALKDKAYENSIGKAVK